MRTSRSSMWRKISASYASSERTTPLRSEHALPLLFGESTIVPMKWYRRGILRIKMQNLYMSAKHLARTVEHLSLLIHRESRAEMKRSVRLIRQMSQWLRSCGPTVKSTTGRAWGSSGQIKQDFSLDCHACRGTTLGGAFAAPFSV